MAYGIYGVGGYFNPDRRPVAEGVSVRFNKSGLLVCITYDEPTPEEIEEIRKGNFQIKFAYVDEFIAVLLKYGSLNWMDALLMDLRTDKIPPAACAGEGIAVTTVLCEARDTEIKVIRLTATSHDQASVLYDRLASGAPIKDSFTLLAASRLVQGRYSTHDLLMMAQ